MKTYKEFRPTSFDASGLGLEDRQTWLVGPVSQTRDSGPLERSNFVATLRELGEESETVEVHRFGHWGPGYFEIILIDPADTSRVEIAEEIENALEDYPIVDEMLFSEYETDECEKTWSDCYNANERLAYFRKHSWSNCSKDIGIVLRAIKHGSWYDAANLLHCPSDLLH